MELVLVRASSTVECTVRQRYGMSDSGGSITLIAFGTETRRSLIEVAAGFEMSG